mmetsp:Transcript_70559/g.187594  ORF Transcript_70559/g.187594 Transcript_70559/m.187594 type:complete len:211 (+) Transcript_70559:189-821(+)
MGNQAHRPRYIGNLWLLEVRWLKEGVGVVEGAGLRLSNGLTTETLNSSGSLMVGKLFELLGDVMITWLSMLTSASRLAGPPTVVVHTSAPGRLRTVPMTTIGECGLPFLMASLLLALEQHVGHASIELHAPEHHHGQAPVERQILQRLPAEVGQVGAEALQVRHGNVQALLAHVRWQHLAVPGLVEPDRILVPLEVDNRQGRPVCFDGDR